MILTGLLQRHLLLHIKLSDRIHVPDDIARIHFGAMADTQEVLPATDWAIEVITEDPARKGELYDLIGEHVHPTLVLTSNTSSIPLSRIAQGKPEGLDRILGLTHFFNPADRMALVETESSVAGGHALLAQIDHYVQLLGKSIVHTRDVPGFVANPIGAYTMARAMNLLAQGGQLEELEFLFGPAVGAAAGPFRTADLVKLKTMIGVSDLMAQSLLDDNWARPDFVLPQFARDMNRDGATFYQQKGKAVYDPNDKTVREVRQLPSDLAAYAARLPKEFPHVVKELWENRSEYRRELAVWIGHAFHELPRVTLDGNPRTLDDAMEWGYGRRGPATLLRIVGTDKVIAEIEAIGKEVPAYLKAVSSEGNGEPLRLTSVGDTEYFDMGLSTHQQIPLEGRVIVPEIIRRDPSRVKEKLSGVTLYEPTDDNILAVQITTKVGAIDLDVISGLSKAIALAREGEYDGLIIHGTPRERYGSGIFSFGANLGLMTGLSLLTAEGHRDKAEAIIGKLIDCFQALNRKIRLSESPILVAKDGMALGGGLEIGLGGWQRITGDAVLSLPEVLAGLLPGGGGITQVLVEEYRKATNNGLNPGVSPDVYVAAALDRLLGVKKYQSKNGYHARHIGWISERDGITPSPPHLLADAVDDIKSGRFERQSEVYVPVNGPTTREHLADKIAQYAAALAKAPSFKHNPGYAQKVVDAVTFVVSGGDSSGNGSLSENRFLGLEKQQFMGLVLSGPDEFAPTGTYQQIGGKARIPGAVDAALAQNKAYAAKVIGVVK